MMVHECVEYIKKSRHAENREHIKNKRRNTVRMANTQMH